MSVHIQVFIPGYNVEPFIERCLESVAMQDYPDFEVAMVDDASTDATGKIMSRYLRPEWAILGHGDMNRKMPRNLTLIRNFGAPDDVVFILDGDDFLPHADVLSTIAGYHTDPDLWLTYGSYTRHPDPTFMPNPALPFPESVIEERDFRLYSNEALIYNHPLTFRRWLFNEVSDAELQDDGGNWFTRCYDHVIMMPMLELAADGHFLWLPEVLYTYSEENPISEAKDGNWNDSARIHRTVNARPKRDAL